MLEKPTINEKCMDFGIKEFPQLEFYDRDIQA
jgi:hypothetical protein